MMQNIKFTKYAKAWGYFHFFPGEIYQIFRK